jgi:hypothetical protein
MVDKRDNYEVVPFPAMRRLVVDGGRLAARRHAIHGLIEVDVTEPRRYFREHKARTGETLSFTAFAIACLGKAVDADKRIHACRNWRNQLVIFDEVNVNTAFDAETSDRAVHHDPAGSQQVGHEFYAEQCPHPHYTHPDLRVLWSDESRAVTGGDHCRSVRSE